jgi:signal transduction histidine kinase
MGSGGVWPRLFIGFLIATLPILVLFVWAIVGDSLLRTADHGLVAVLAGIGTLMWAGILSIVFSRSVMDDVREMLAMAQRGEPAEARELSNAYNRLAATLDERNRQIETLVRETASIPIDDQPPRVVQALVSTVQSVMRDATWRAGVLDTEDPQLLAAGVYGAPDDAGIRTEVGELERWASAMNPDAAASRIEGPWGSFVVIHGSATERLRAILYAPWEGRADPTPAEIAILSLVGQHFRAAVDHSLLYARLRQQTEQLDHMARLQADFLRGVTHDLQTPLTRIAGLARELHADEALSTAGRDDLRTITDQADRLRRMVSQLLVASRLEAGALAPNVEVFAVAPVVERTWTAIRSDGPFELTVDGPAHLAIADPDRLEQVLWAVLDNAVKYSPAGSPVDIDITPDDGMLLIIVRDRGAGMDEETLARAFEQFYRGPSAARLAPDGSGIGLYAARGLMEAMRGSIDAVSRLGQGTTIEIRVPAEPSDEAE